MRGAQLAELRDYLPRLKIKSVFDPTSIFRHVQGMPAGLSSLSS